MSTIQLDIDPTIKKFNGNVGQFFTGLAFVAPPVVSTDGVATFDFPVRPGQDWIFFRAQFDFDLDIGNATGTNTSVVNWYKNNVLQTGTLSAVAGDRIRVQVTRTNSALAASVDVDMTGIENDVTITAQNFFFPRLTGFATNCSESDDLVHGRFTDSLLFSNGGTSGYRVAATSDFTIQSPCEMIYSTPSDYTQYWFGFNDEVTVTFPGTTYYNRCRYAIRPFNGLRADVVELGTFKFTSNTKQLQSWVKIADDGSTVKYYYSDDQGTTWNLYYTSLLSYSQKAYRTDVGVNAGLTEFKRLPAKCVQL
ncbi:MAG: hypothetical protein GWN62_16885 [Aliifodinibius sp.]|nr:hypothetical protein [Fodinibius sp.]